MYKRQTLANLVARFFDPQNGRVLIGNTDIRSIPKEILMDQVSFVFQNSHLIKASILENVRMARPEATREDVLEALKAAQCMDIIGKLPKGIDLSLIHISCAGLGFGSGQCPLRDRPIRRAAVPDIRKISGCLAGGAVCLPCGRGSMHRTGWPLI